MPKLVVNGALLKCSQGAAPGSLTVLPTEKTDAGNQPAATVDDYKPMVNIPTFAMCNSTSNPSVISATAAAQGVHTPMPCVPNTTSPWSPGSKVVTINDKKALTADSTCKCAWNGTIEVSQAGGEPDLDE